MAIPVTLVIPCYNEAERLAVDVFRGYRPEGFALQMLFVDDGSTDATRQVLEQLAEPGAREVLALERNQGKAEAVRRGVLHAMDAGAELVGFWDADLATPLEELPRFVRVMEMDSRIEAVFGARVKLLGRTIDRKGYRHYYGRAFATLVSTLLDLPIYDSQCGAKLFRAGDVTRYAFAKPFLSRWIFDVELLARMIELLEPDEIEERLYELQLDTWIHVGGSKVSATDGVRAIEELARIGARYRDALLKRRRRRRAY